MREVALTSWGRLAGEWRRSMARGPLGISMVLLLMLTGCGTEASEDPPATGTRAEPTSTSSSPGPEEGDLILSSGGSVHYRCVGEGSPAMLLEAGTDSGGTDSLPSSFVDP